MKLNKPEVLHPKAAEKLKRSWFILLASFLIRVIVFGQLYSVGILYIHWLSEFKRPRGETALIGSIATGSTLLIGPFAAHIYENFDISKTIILFGLLSSFGIICSYFATNVAFLIVTLGLITGISNGIVNFGAVLSIGKYFYTNRPIAMGVGSAGVGIGALLYGFLQQYLVNEFSWRGALLIAGGIQLNLVVCGMVIREPTVEMLDKDTLNSNDENKNVVQNKEKTEDISVEETISKPKEEINTRLERFKQFIGLNQRVLMLLRNPIFICLFLGDLLSWQVQFIPYVHIPLRAHKLGISNFAFLVSLMGIFNAIGKAFFGALCTYYQKNSFCIYVASQFMFAISVLVSPLCVTIWSLTAFAITFGFLSGNYCLMMVFPVDLLGLDNFSYAYGLLLASEGIGVYLGPPIVGWLSEYWNSYESSLLFAGVVTFFSALIVLPIICLKQRPKSIKQTTSQV